VISLAPGTKVFLACRPIDLRNGFDGLAAKAQQVIGADPFSGHLFIFRGRRGKHTTFNIQFTSRDDCVSVASVVRADVAGLSTSARQGTDVHLHGRTSWTKPGTAELDVRPGLLRRHDARDAPDQLERSG
jgi:transposase